MAQQRAGVGLTGFASLPPVAAATPSDGEREVLLSIREVLAGKRFVLLTGAGLSTDSGIPDYRGPGSPPRSPMTYQEFVKDEANRQRYWARNHIGWSHLRHADPNQGHYAAAELERRGYLTGLITQNVDRLHQEMQRIMSAPDMKKRAADIGLIPIDSPAIPEIRRYIAAEQEKWGSLVRKLGLEGTQ